MKVHYKEHSNGGIVCLSSGCFMSFSSSAEYTTHREDCCAPKEGDRLKLLRYSDLSWQQQLVSIYLYFFFVFIDVSVRLSGTEVPGPIEAGTNFE